MSSIYSWFWPHLCDEWRTELLRIVKTGQVTREECEETLSYLQRRDVKTQVDGYIKKAGAITCTEHYAKTLDLVVLEVDLFDQDQTYIGTMNFWPCADCANVAFEKRSEQPQRLQVVVE